MIGAIAAATLFNLATAHYFVQTTTSGDRLALSWEGTIANSNDLAAHLLLVLPFLLFYLIKPGTNTIVRVVAAGALSVGLFTVLHTGSRGALVALIVTVLYVLITGSMKQRVAVAILTPLMALALLSLIPASTWNRLTSFSESDASSAEAIESTQSREYLFQKSILFTFQRPIFGVGPGQFSSYEGSTEVSQGERGNWHETHNSYTQVSSECGIPALIFYLLALFSTFGLLRKIKKKATEEKQQEIVMAVFCVTIALVAYCTATAFVSFAYRFYLPALSGLVIAIWRAVQEDRGLVKVVAKPRPFRAAVTNERVLT
jgi:O-antigen ligase